MSKGKSKENYYDNRANQAISNVATIDPVEEALKKKTKRFLDWQSGESEYAGKPKNILDAPGIDETLDIYGGAQRLADQERFGDGAVRLADPAGGTQYATQMKQQRDFDLHDARAEGVSRALNDLTAQNTGQAGNLIGYDMNRKATVAGLESQNRRDYYNRPKSTPWWKQVIGAAIPGMGG